MASRRDQVFVGRHDMLAVFQGFFLEIKCRFRAADDFDDHIDLQIFKNVICILRQDGRIFHFGGKVRDLQDKNLLDHDIASDLADHFILLQLQCLVDAEPHGPQTEKTNINRILFFHLNLRLYMLKGTVKKHRPPELSLFPVRLHSHKAIIATLSVIDNLSEIFFERSTADQTAVDVFLAEEFCRVGSVDRTAVQNADL